jgi:hypothetical protein
VSAEESRERAEAVSLDEPEEMPVADHLCSHGCGMEGTVLHAGGRLLCRGCYHAETGGSAWGVPDCPTCGPELEEDE